MSGAAALPASVAIVQNIIAPLITISQQPAAATLPVYPLASDPGQNWVQQEVDGVLTWVQLVPPPGQTSFGLEDDIGGIQLEDGGGSLLLEP